MADIAGVSQQFISSMKKGKIIPLLKSVFKIKMFYRSVSRLFLSVKKLLKNSLTICNVLFFVMYDTLAFALTKRCTAACEICCFSSCPTDVVMFNMAEESRVPNHKIIYYWYDL